MTHFKEHANNNLMTSMKYGINFSLIATYAIGRSVGQVTCVGYLGIRGHIPPKVKPKSNVSRSAICSIMYRVISKFIGRFSRSIGFLTKRSIFWVGHYKRLPRSSVNHLLLLWKAAYLC